MHRRSGNVGIVLQLAYQRGYISAEERRRVFGVMRQLGLAIWHEVCTTEVLMQVGSCVFHNEEGNSDTACNLKRCPVCVPLSELLHAVDKRSCWLLMQTACRQLSVWLHCRD